MTRSTARGALELGALGVVFGDIGTSPLYTVQTVFAPSDPHPVRVSAQNVFGVVSLIFWSVTIIVTVTYVLLVMRADNNGEGGIMALITLIRRQGVTHVTALGYMDQPDVPSLLPLIREVGVESRIDGDKVSYFLSTIELRRGNTPGMSRWRKRLFVATSRITADAAEYFRLPRDRTVIMGSRIEL